LALTRWSKIWIAITVISLLAYELYWINNIYGNIFNRFTRSGFPAFPSLFWADPFLLAIGDSFRIIGILLALFSIYLFWGPKPKSFFAVKKIVAIAALFEAVFFICGLPANLIFTIASGRGASFITSLAYLLQSVVVPPLLIVLSIKIWRYQESTAGFVSLLKWAGAAALAYLLGIWFVNVLKWLSMAQTGGLAFLLSGVASLGFLNSAITLSFAVVLAVAGFYALLRKKEKLSLRLIALALILVGLHFILFIVYSAVTNSWRWVLLTEIWPIPLLGLGLSLLWNKKTSK
jgi:hypothetical protein